MIGAPLDHLPHRAPFRFVTDVTDLQPGVSGTGIWTLSGTEGFFAGHFPGEPLVPGVLIGEALAQLAGLVGFHSSDAAGAAGRLVHIDLRFDAPVRPPVVVTLSARATRTLGQLHQFDAAARVGDQIVARGSLTLAAVAPAASPLTRQPGATR